MSNITMINSWAKTLKLTVMLICKTWAMTNKFMNINPKKKRKFILITILNVCNKTWKSFTKLEKQSLKKNKLRLDKREKQRSKESKIDIKTKKNDSNQPDLDQKIIKLNKNRMTKLKKLRILRLIIKSNSTILWLISMMMITTFQIMKKKLTTRIKKLIPMKKLMVNCLMMTLMSFQKQWLIWKKEENLLKKLNWKNKRSLKSLSLKVKMLEAKFKLLNKNKWKIMI